VKVSAESIAFIQKGLKKQRSYADLSRLAKLLEKHKRALEERRKARKSG
jgi:hypothetical protein